MRFRFHHRGQIELDQRLAAIGCQYRLRLRAQCATTALSSVSGIVKNCSACGSMAPPITVDMVALLLCRKNIASGMRQQEDVGAGVQRLRSPYRYQASAVCSDGSPTGSRLIPCVDSRYCKI